MDLHNRLVEPNHGVHKATGDGHASGAHPTKRHEPALLARPGGLCNIQCATNTVHHVLCSSRATVDNVLQPGHCAIIALAVKTRLVRSHVQRLHRINPCDCGDTWMAYLIDHSSLARCCYARGQDTHLYSPHRRDSTPSTGDMTQNHIVLLPLSIANVYICPIF